MNSKKTFNSQFKNRGTFASYVTNDEIKNETMFFNSDLNFAYENGGPITRSFISQLPDDWEGSDVVFDSRGTYAYAGVVSCNSGVPS
ncbi:conserved hypothetical protein [Aeromonas phage 65]|uniref:Uncharacterized protein n=1 Tax=Aeromonas phage 65 TaxID=2919549 RepID=E5DSE0_9CAUD|nr:hypothetical protein ST65p306 [Aeromonas phage 65]ADQ53314.1 conserved hypothetical protein [Aeromonas phage 65]